ncbi:MAG: helix-turn-helix transcriptional regulator [Chloroflexi bacterium]|nr:helix-turn-helix transcriptional regulator [Chloroflexota bacterium]
MFGYNHGVSDLQLAALIVVAGVALALALWLRRRTRRTQSKRLTVQVIPPAPAPSERRWLWDSLTAREMQVAHLVVQGKRNAEIAEELTISVHTVESHLKHIYAKLGVHSRGELTRVLRDLLDALA